VTAQRLAGPPFSSPVEAVASLGAVQAQDYAGAKWALGMRTHGVSDAELDELFDAGALLRTHVMRPTWHFVAPDDAAWLLRLTAPRVKAIMAPYDRRLEIDAALLRRSHRVLETVLRDGVHLTRAEIGARFRAKDIDATGQRLGHLVSHAELDGIVASGRRKGKQHTYALLAERAPKARQLSREEAVAELALRFFTGHGPAQLVDWAWWSGLTVADGRRGIASAGSALVSEVVGGKTYWSSPRERPARAKRGLVHLLPNYDELLIAYRDRESMVDASVQLAAASIINHVVVRDGRVFGGWKRTQARDGVVVEVGPLGGFDDVAVAGLHEAARKLSAFLGRHVQVTGLDADPQLRERTGWA